MTNVSDHPILCEICGEEPVTALSCFETFRLQQPISRWALVGFCQVNDEDYYVPTDQLQTNEQVQGWLKHLSEKVWFHESSRRSFLQALFRLNRQADKAAA